MRLGCVKYLNARPLIRGWRGEAVFDHPAALAEKLQAGALQIALVSSFEFLRNPNYRIVDGVSISSDGPVYSVLVAHCGEISGVEEIELDPASLTSVALLRCLLGEMNLHPRLVSTSNAKSPAEKRARLLIGDQAIRFRKDHEQDFQYWDLGAEWKRLTNLPFVYALWLVRPEVIEAASVADELRNLRDNNLANMETLIAEETGDEDFCRFYYRDCLRFGFGEKEKEGLCLFQNLCEKHKILPHAPFDAHRLAKMVV